jgi:uncharacterized protein YkwD
MTGSVGTASRAVLALLLAVLLAGLLPAPQASAADRRSAEQVQTRLETLVNRKRAAVGVRQLRISARLERYAGGHSADMAARGLLYHDAALRAEVLSGASAWGENVGRTKSDDAALALHRMFLASPAHRANVLRSRWTHMGIGVVKRNGVVYVTQRFVDAR